MDTTALPAGKPQRSISGLGLASFILGTVALMFSWLPIAGCALIPVAILGLALGVPALFLAIRDRNRGLGFPIAGIIMNLLALLVCVVMMVILAAAAQEVIEEVERQNSTQQAPVSPLQPE